MIRTTLISSLLRVARTTALLLVALLPALACALEPERPGQSSFLTRAVFAEGRLWILSDAGNLSSLAEGDEAWARELLAEKALDLCRHEGRPWLVTGANGGTQWTLRRRAGGAWSTAAVVETEGDKLLALDCGASGITLLTTRRLIGIDGDRQNTVALAGPPLNKRALVSSTYGTPGEYIVGFNAGEWGGGLRRIDRRSGAVTVVERNISGGVCGGPLNPACDPVNGITADPWKPGCVVAAIGLVHFQPHGRIVEVCAAEVQRLYVQGYGENATSRRSRDDEPLSTVAFFGVTSDSDAVWAVGIDGIYEIGADGTGRVVPLPHFKDVGGIAVSFELPRFVLVRTNVNQRRSVSGAVPLLVLR